MRRFFMTLPIQETVSLKLSWSHYNSSPPSIYLPTEAELKHELEQERVKVQAQLIDELSEK